MKRRERRLLSEVLHRQTKTPCLLCGRKPYVGSLYFAKDQTRVCAPAGKTRAIAYTLCRRCHKSADVQAKIERVIFREVPMAAAAPNN